MATRPTHQGACEFMYYDWQTLNPTGLKNVVIPLRAVAVSFVLDEPVDATSDRSALRALMLQRYRAFFEAQGLFYPSEIANLPGLDLNGILEQSRVDLPLGVAAGDVPLPVGSVFGGVFSCASCHAGRLYDERGRPTQKAWLGIPNTSYNVATLIDGFYERLNLILDQWPKFIRRYQELFGVSPMSGQILGLRLSHRQLKTKMIELRDTIGRFRPYPTGAPGLTNGIGAIEYNLGIYPNPHTYNESDNSLVSTPVLYDRALRTSFLVDGFYSMTDDPVQRPITLTELSDPARLDSRIRNIARVATIFTIGTVGTEPGMASRQTDRVYRAVKFISGQSAPQFPGPVDQSLAVLGQAVYQSRCASCHGTYAGPMDHLRLVEFPNRKVAVNTIGTDPTRLRRIRSKDIETLSSLEVARGISARASDGYVALPLTALWLTAPYLHNGSVPSLWDLMHPEQRPSSFKVGGHALRYDRMGIDYPEGYQPFSTPFTYDTSRPGQSNLGHVSPFDEMSESDKRALLEYLKLL